MPILLQQQSQKKYQYYNIMSTRAKYQRVNAKSELQQSKSDTDIILKKSQRYGKYIGRALTLFFDEKKPFVVLKAAQRIIQRAIWVAQVLKRKVGGLHQVTRISEKKIVDVYTPKEQGLLEVRQQRFLTVIEILLTKEPTSGQKAEPGYQQPIKVDQKELLTNEKWQQQKEQRAERRRKYEQGENDRKGDRQQRRQRREDRGERRQRRQDRGERRQRREQGQRGERRQRRQDRRQGGERRQGGDRRRQDRRQGGERRQDRGERRQERRQGGERRRGRN